jgi:hypothetical protein
MDTGMFPENIFTGMLCATVSLVSVLVSGFFSDWNISSTGNSLH